MFHKLKLHPLIFPYTLCYILVRVHFIAIGWLKYSNSKKYFLIEHLRQQVLLSGYVFGIGFLFGLNHQ